MQVPFRLGQNKFLSTILPIHFFLDLERWGQAFHSVSMSISLLIYFLAAQYHCKFTTEINLKTAKISIFTSWVSPVEWPKGLFIPKITALSKALGVSWRSYCSVTINGWQKAVQEASERLGQASSSYQVKRIWRRQSFSLLIFINPEKHSAVTCCQLSSHSAC